MTPTERTMPTLTATWDEMLRAWLLELPGHITMSGRTAADVEAIVAKHAPGSAIRYYRIAGVTESELRAMGGDR